MACWIDTRSGSSDPFSARIERTKGATFQTWRKLRFSTNDLANLAVSGEGADPDGDGPIRCMYLTNGASISGFTLTNGGTRAVTYGEAPLHEYESYGGGVWCESTNSVVLSNCVVAGNSAYFAGGGAYGGTLNNCTLNVNSTSYLDGAGGLGGRGLLRHAEQLRAQRQSCRIRRWDRSLHAEQLHLKQQLRY